MRKRREKKRKRGELSAPRAGRDGPEAAAGAEAAAASWMSRCCSATFRSRARCSASANIVDTACCETDTCERREGGRRKTECKRVSAGGKEADRRVSQNHITQAKPLPRQRRSTVHPSLSISLSHSLTHTHPHFFFLTAPGFLCCLTLACLLLTAAPAAAPAAEPTAPTAAQRT